MFDDLKHLSVADLQKCVKSGRGQMLFHSTVYKALSFHTFSSDKEIRKRWIINIRRENLSISRHFKEEDITEPGSETVRHGLKKFAIPALHE